MQDTLTYRPKKLAILGGGESGAYAAILAQQKGLEPFLSDAGELKQEYRSLLREYNISFEEGQHSTERILGADEVIKSPGIPDSAEIILRLKAQQSRIISELDFAARYTSAKLIGITGTNGKTTTTRLLEHILKKAGLKAKAAGNIGHSLARCVLEDKDIEIYVLEVSSFQLDYQGDLRFDIALLLNITPDHLDRYGYDLDAYVQSKLKITLNQRSADYFIYNIDNHLVTEGLKYKHGEATELTFSLNRPAEAGAWWEQGKIKLAINGQEEEIDMESFVLSGLHNQANGMAAAIAAKVINVRNNSIRDSLADFKNEPHRLEYVASIGGARYINDSKATNVNAAWYALESGTEPIIWIAGGVDKGNDYAPLIPLANERVKALICLGKDNETLKSAFESAIGLVLETDSMEEAVKMAYALSSKGDSIMLAPACASFDLFDSYEHRGDEFKKHVRRL